jgi:hypothetical protein
MKTFQETIQSNGLEFVRDLMNGYTMVYEKINASTLSFKRIDDTLYFFKGRNNEEINSINSMLYSYFQDGIDHVKRTSLIWYKELPENWLFRMQYVIQNDNNMINYNNMPQNNLILSCIDTGNTIIEDPNVLKKWADRLQIDYAQPVFNGFLSEFQKERLVEYLQNGDLNGISFSQYIISLLNPQMTHSALSDEFMGGIDSFIFKFYKPGAKKSTTLKLIDPYMTALIQQNKHEFGKIDGTESEVVLANFIAYLQTVNLNTIEAQGETEEERYIDVICKLFNNYIKKEQELLKGIKGDVNESYSVNLDKIKNTETVELLRNNPSLTTVFQIITGMFMNKKDDNNPNSLISGSVMDAFNKEVSDIWNHVSDKAESVQTFKELMGGDKTEAETEKVMTFTEYMNNIGRGEEYLSNDDEGGKSEETEKDGNSEKQAEQPSETEHNDKPSESGSSETTVSDSGKEPEKEEPTQDKNEATEKSDEVKNEETDSENKESGKEKEAENKESENNESENKDSENKESEDNAGDKEKGSEKSDEKSDENKDNGETDKDGESEKDEPKKEEPSENDKGKTEEKDEPKKEESKKDEPNDDEPKKDEPKKEEPKKEEPKKDEPKKEKSNDKDNDKSDSISL